MNESIGGHFAKLRDRVKFDVADKSASVVGYLIPVALTSPPIVDVTNGYHGRKRRDFGFYSHIICANRQQILTTPEIEFFCLYVHIR